MAQQELKKIEIEKIPEGWALARLAEITLDLIGGGTPSTSQPDYWDGDIPWMTSANLTDRIILSGMRYITKKGLRNSATNIVPKGSLLISTRVGIGKVGIAGIDVAISQDLTGLVLDNDKVDVEYLYWAFLSQSSHLGPLSQGSTVKGLTRDYLRNLSFFLPPLPEQKKIAEILSTVGQAIEKVDEAIEKTQRLKKGLMQELLTKGIGHKKFRDTEIGKIPKEWEVVGLNDISIDLIGGGTPSTSNSDYWNGDIAWMTSAHIDGREIKNGQRYITKEGLKNSATNLVPQNNLLVATRVGIGKVAVNKIDIAISQDLTGVIIDKGKAIPDFLYWAIIYNEKRLKSLAQGSTIKGVLREDLGKIKLSIPTLKEQQKIAEILGGVDERLELLRARRVRLEKTKKGLMNDLLTGRKRVNA